jgi:hypothetical protein
MRCSAIFTLVAFALLSASTTAEQYGYAASISSDSLIVYRVGDGSTALTADAAPVFLDVFGFDGTHRDTIAVPSTGPNAMTATGNDPTEGAMSRSADRRAYYFTGYRKDAGGASPSADTSIVTPRVAANIRLSGVVDTSIAIIDAPLGAIRSSASEDGSEYWLGTVGGIRYVGAPGGASTSVEVDGREARQLRIDSGMEITPEGFERVLYASNGSAETAAKVVHYDGLPTGSAAATAMVTLTNSDAINAFVVLEVSPANNQLGVDFLYALSTSEGLLRKYELDGISWLPRGSIATNATHLTAFRIQADVSIFLTTPTELQLLTDNVFAELPNAANSLTTLATAEANTAFRGIDFTFSPGVPEPSAQILLVHGFFMLSTTWSRWSGGIRRRQITILG